MKNIIEGKKMTPISMLYESINKLINGNAILQKDDSSIFFVLDNKKDLLVFSVNIPLNKINIGQEYDAIENGGISKHDWNWYSNSRTGGKKYQYQAKGSFLNPLDLTFQLKGIPGTFRVFDKKQIIGQKMKFEKLK